MVAQCRQPGVSIAGVALANGLNANLVRRWVVDSEEGADSGTAVTTSKRKSSRSTEAEFLPVRVAADGVAHGDIRIALQGRVASIEVRWPVSAADDCARWLRALLECAALRFPPSNWPASCCQSLLILPLDPVLQETDRRQVSQRGVAAAPVVEHGDVLEQIAARLVARGVARPMDSLVLEAVEEALGY